MIKEIEILRKEINVLDEQIVSSICKRIQVCKNIGDIKKQNSINVVDNNRWEEVKNQIIEFAKNNSTEETIDTNTYLIDIIYELIHVYSCKLQNK